MDAVLKGAPAQNPVVVSISWGVPEDDPQLLSGAAVQAISAKLLSLASLGITVCVSSGDDGSGDQVSDGACHVDFPASSPGALGVGGTEISPQGAEVVWWDPPGRRTGQARRRDRGAE